MAKDGVQPACPSGWDSAAPIVIGTGVNLACSTCSCVINSSSTCTNAKVDFWNNSACANNPASTVIVDGTCKVPTGIGQNVDHFKYSATLNTVCQGTGAKTPTVDLAMPVSLCCKM